MGLDNRHVFALAMALSLAVVAIAGVLLAVRTNFDPAIGPARLIFGFEAVIIGGLGSLWGTLAGGIMLGVAQAIGAQDRSRLADPRRPSRVPARAGGAAGGPVPEGARMSACASTFPAGRRASAWRLVAVALVAARGGAALGRSRRPAAAGRDLRLCGAGEPVEPARRLCRPRLGRPAGLCGPRCLSAVRADDPGRRSAALGDPDRGRDRRGDRRCRSRR